MHVREYPFHDGRLTSIAVADSHAVLGMRQTDGTEFLMTLTGVEALSVDGFRLGNTVLALRSASGECSRDGVLSGQEIGAAMDALFPAPHVSAAAHHQEAHASFIASRLDHLSRGEATLVVLAPVYGAALCAYCVAIDLRGRPPA
jgi:hypothetical protein